MTLDNFGSIHLDMLYNSKLRLVYIYIYILMRTIYYDLSQKMSPPGFALMKFDWIGFALLLYTKCDADNDDDDDDDEVMMMMMMMMKHYGGLHLVLSISKIS